MQASAGMNVTSCRIIDVFALAAPAALLATGSAPAAGLPDIPTAALVLQVTGETARDVASLIRQGDDALRSGNPDAAITALDAAIVRAPERAQVWRLRGAARMQKRDYVGAIADFDQAILRDAGDHVAYRMRGNAWFLTRDRERAIRDYDHAIELDPGDDVAFLLRGIYHIAQNGLDAARADFDRAIAVNPASVEAYLQRGMIHERAKAYDLAFADYDAVIRLNPYSARAYVRRGGLWLQRGPTEDNLNHAIADLQRAVSVNAADAQARGQLQQMIAMKELLQKARAETR